ncbi:DUF429 domain-containing protein [Bdellovibrio sp. 22V]|uniref:DUF429 domain-containing protein n=1 Tax=Bdellovibrio TaxID=958 RepID=UPI00254302B4|nr:DUF429 domain-containing protein [Bdellovibrio sp. 22V]WII71272.1 DUF429 domain-containing protein [Bdellovibrio sp. 22V]
MPKVRLSGDGRKTRRSSVKTKTKRAVVPAGASAETSHAGVVHRFIGISLSGGKSDKACVAVLEYYPKHKKVFLSRLVEKIKSDEVHSADFKIHEIIAQYHGDVDLIAFDVPFRLPNCLTCPKGCPGIEACKEPHVQWMWEYTRKLHKKKKPRKLFTPYTQRCVEMYLSSELEEPFNMQHAMGANVAPLLARAMFLRRRLETPCVEVFPKLSVWRIGRSLGVMKSHLRFHKHSIGGDESRREILQALSTHNVAFVYDQDVKLMIENNHAFEAFVCAFTAFLKYKNLTEPRPEGFPGNEDWIEFPKSSINWNSF